MYMEDGRFEEVPFSIMRPEEWNTAKLGMWGDSSEHITLKEGRAFILSMRRLSRDQGQRGKRCCMLVDNLALAMCISKGRAHSYSMLRVCQQYSALSLATDMQNSCSLGAFGSEPSRWPIKGVAPAEFFVGRGRAARPSRV